MRHCRCRRRRRRLLSLLWIAILDPRASRLDYVISHARKGAALESRMKDCKKPRRQRQRTKTSLVLRDRLYSNSFSLFNVVELSSNRTGGKGVQVVSLAAVLCLVTQRSSPQTAAHIRTTFLSHCFCGLMKGPIMYQQIENDVSVRAKKDNGTSGRSFCY